MTSLTKARQPEIIRSHQKDDFYSGVIRGRLGDVMQRLLGARTWIRWHTELDLCADLTYLALTTVGGYQTLGEEYVNMIQVCIRHINVMKVYNRHVNVIQVCNIHFNMIQLCNRHVNFIQVCFRHVKVIQVCNTQVNNDTGV